MQLKDHHRWDSSGTPQYYISVSLTQFCRNAFWYSGIMYFFWCWFRDSGVNTLAIDPILIKLNSSTIPLGKCLRSSLSMFENVFKQQLLIGFVEAHHGIHRKYGRVLLFLVSCFGCKPSASRSCRWWAIPQICTICPI